mmetsp:Transcript_33033/g.79659  ORF Transcript_33033/g.79659 Transcript_33033/m.79659 type:complete len:200 (+) Transcript_33033:897-1496(+)
MSQLPPPSGHRLVVPHESQALLTHQPAVAGPEKVPEKLRHVLSPANHVPAGPTQNRGCLVLHHHPRAPRRIGRLPWDCERLGERALLAQEPEGGHARGVGQGGGGEVEVGVRGEIGLVGSDNEAQELVGRATVPRALARVAQRGLRGGVADERVHGPFLVTVLEYLAIERISTGILKVRSASSHAQNLSNRRLRQCTPE